MLKVTTGTGALSVITDSSSNWDTAYGWGDHASGGYILHSLADAEGDFLVASGDDTFVKKTLAETGAILEADINHDNLVGFESGEHYPVIDEDDMNSDSDAHVPTQQSVKAYADAIAAGAGAPTDASYLTLGLDGDLSAERVLTAGTGIQFTDTGANGTLTVASKDSEIDHGGLAGLTDNDHTQYILHSLADAENDFLVASGDDAFVKKTLAETGAILETDINHDNLVGFEAGEHYPVIDEDDLSSDSDAHVPTQQSVKAYADAIAAAAGA